MPAPVERCGACGQFVYRLQLWISGNQITLDAGTKKAFIIDDIISEKVYEIPVFRLTEAEPSEVFIVHRCKGVPR